MFAELIPAEKPRPSALHFSSIGEEDLSTCLQATFDKHSIAFQKGSTLQFERDKCRIIYCVTEGWLALSKALADGQNQIIDFALPGDIVDPAAADGATSAMTVTALTHGKVATVPRRIWSQMINTWPTLQRRVSLKQAAVRARYSERLLRLGKGTADMRIAYALLEFCTRVGHIGKAGLPEFHIPMTQQQLGDYVGLSSVHVCRTMRRMKRNGIIAMQKHMHVTILDMMSLSALAGVEEIDLKREIIPIRF